MFFFFKQKTAYEMRISDWNSDVCSSDLLQELHNGPYFCQHESVDEFDLAETIPGPSTERLSGLAKQHGVVLVSSLFEKRATGLYHNTAVVFDADGSTAGKYRKMHIPDDPGFYEKFYFTPGDLGFRSEEHTSELQSLMPISYAVFCLKKKNE